MKDIIQFLIYILGPFAVIKQYINVLQVTVTKAYLNFVASTAHSSLLRVPLRAVCVCLPQDRGV